MQKVASRDSWLRTGEATFCTRPWKNWQVGPAGGVSRGRICIQTSICITFERRRKNRSRGGLRVAGNGQIAAKTRCSKNVIKPMRFWWVWCFWGANNEAFVDFSLVLLMFRETWFGNFWRVFGPMDSHDFRVCDFALFYFGFWMSLVFWGRLKGWNCDPRGGFKAKVNIEDATSWGLHFGGSARAKIMKCHGFKNALFSMLILKFCAFEVPFGWCCIAFSLKKQ